MKQNIKSWMTGAALLSVVASCNFLEVEKIQDLNNPTVESVLSNASAPQIAQLGVGLQSSMRNNYGDFASIAGSIGREIVVFATTDNRYYTELQGKSAIDPGGIFYPWWNGFNTTRRRAEIFTRSADNTTSLTAAQKSAVKGFARTAQAYVMLNALNMMGKTGIRTEFSDLQAPGDLLKPGPFVTYEQGLVYVKQLVDEGASELDKAGTAFPFPLTRGWAGYSTPANFKKFNRAVAARVAMYQKDWAGMSTAVGQSFINLNGDLAAGPQFTYSTTAGDATNPFFKPQNEPGVPWAAQVNFVREAEAGDTRVFGPAISDAGVAKVRKRKTPALLGGFPESEYEMQLVPTNVTPLSIIRNEELILMKAEADIQTNKLADAVIALNKIRTANGLKALAEAKPMVVNSQAGLIDELLNQRRYSLFMEGHRWFDMRRYNRLAALPKDLPEHQVWDSFPKPQAEVDWDKSNG